MRVFRRLWWILFLIVLATGIAIALLARTDISRARAKFPPAPIENPLAAENTFGTTVDLTLYDESALITQLDAMQAAGLVWLRQPFRWADIEPERGQFRWEKYDRAVEAARLRGFKIIAVLDTSPEWARPPGTPAETPPREVTDFGAFARTLAHHYQNDIHTFQIWHEPNLSAHWGGGDINPAEYTLLLKNAAIPIRAVQPQATIISAALAPTLERNNLNLAEPDFLQQMYAAGAAPYFDILGAELLGFHLPIEKSTADSAVLNIKRVELLRRVMAANGDADTPVWATAFGWHALPADWDGAPPTFPTDVPEKQLARTETALAFARQNWDWLGVICATRWDTAGLTADDPARGFALSPTMLPPFENAAHTLPAIATVGAYPATHPVGQYSPGWRYAPPLVDIPNPTESPATLTIPFSGTRLDLRINRGDFRGYLWVSVDGAPANALPRDERGKSYVVLTDPLRQPATVTLARYLPDDAHTATITADGGWGQWAIAGWTVWREADTRRADRLFALGMIAAVLGGLRLAASGWRNRLTLRELIFGGWRRLVSITRSLPEGAIFAAAFTAAILFLWLPGSVAWVMLPLLGLIFLVRPDSGLAVVTFGISFFLAKKSVPGVTLPALETVLFLLAIAVFLRLFLPKPDSSTLPIADLWRLNRLSNGDWAVLTLVALGLATTFTAQNFGVAMYEWRTVMLDGAIFYFAVRLVPRLDGGSSARLSGMLLDAFVAGAALHALTALWQYAFQPEQTITAEGVRRALGYLYGSPNNLALFLERALPVAVVLAVWGRGRRRWGHAAAVIIIGAALYFTFSKGSLLLAVPATLVFIALLTGGRRAWLGAGSGLILLAMALIPLSRTERFRSAFSLQPGSTGFARLHLWQSAWDMLREHPWTGLGPDNFLYQYRTRYILPSAWAEPNLSHPHNVVLDFGVRLGVGGVLWLVWAQVRFWGRALRRYFGDADGSTRRLLLAAMASMIPFLAHGMVDNAFFLVDLAFSFLLMFAIVENEL